MLAVFISFSISEIGLRFLFQQSLDNTKECRTEDKILHHAFVPGSTCRFLSKEWDVVYNINSIGFRDDEINPKQENEFRILVLGDSFVEGYGVEAKDRFTEILEIELSREIARKVNVINTGIASYSPILEYELLQLKQESLNPDMVIVALDMTDFKDEIGYYNFFGETQKEIQTQDNQTEEYFAVRTDLNRKQTDIQSFKDETNWQKNEDLKFSLRLKMFLRQFRTYVLVTNTIKDLMNIPYLTEGSPPFIEGDVDTDLFAIVRNNLDNEVYNSLWRLPKKSLQNIAKFSKEKNFKLVFFTYPHGMQLDGNQWGKGRLTRGFVRGQTYSVKALDDFVKIGQELNVPTINLYDSLKKEANEKLYFDYDGHWNKRGHRLVAHALSPILKELILAKN